jgi:hypothetical protein
VLSSAPRHPGGLGQVHVRGLRGQELRDQPVDGEDTRPDQQHELRAEALQAHREQEGADGGSDAAHRSGETDAGRAQGGGERLQAVRAAVSGAPAVAEVQAAAKQGATNPFYTPTPEVLAR